MSAARRAAMALAVVIAAMLSACGGDSDAGFAGYSRSPAPQVGDVALPRADGSGEVAFRAVDGGLLLVYFGYTNCPDFCPTTLADLKVALNRLGDAAADVDVAMVTVDPDRDLLILDDYIQSFFADGIALGSADPTVLTAATEPFGVSYLVTDNDAGGTDVAHSTQLYAVDDTGALVLTWPFGIETQELADDIGDLLAGLRP
ncbi:MAG: SCO family protein [Ilumatobacteraceae bacterium]